MREADDSYDDNSNTILGVKKRKPINWDKIVNVITPFSIRSLKGSDSKELRLWFIPICRIWK